MLLLTGDLFTGGGGVGLGLDCESVSLSSSTTSGGRRSARILGLAIPGMRNQSRGASLEKQVMEDIPEQLRTPKVPQVRNRITLLLSGTLKSPVSFLIIGQWTGHWVVPVDSFDGFVPISGVAFRESFSVGVCEYVTIMIDQDVTSATHATD